LRRPLSLVAGAAALVLVPAALAVPIVGTPHNDTITGTDGRDWIYRSPGTTR
jgi:hypothetical protein